jgi:Rrf2 family protein
LAESGQMPERFLLQILRDLTKEGILVSSRGGGGGFSLLRDPSTVSLLELVEAVEGPMTAKLPASGFSPESQETLQRALQKIADITREQLAAIKLSHLLESPRDAMEYSV